NKILGNGDPDALTNAEKEKAAKKLAEEIERLKKLWEDLNKEIQQGVGSDDPFVRGVNEANDKAEEEIKKLQEIRAKELITAKQFADASFLIEQGRLKKVQQLFDKFVKTTKPLSDAPATLVVGGVTPLDPTQAEKGFA